MVKVKSFPICRPSKPFIVCHNFNCRKIQKIYQMGREIGQTKEHLSAKLQSFIGTGIEQGYVAPLCHSHFDGKGGCKVFVIRNEFYHRLIKVNLTDVQKNVLGVSEF